MRRFARSAILIMVVLCAVVAFLTACSGSDTSGTASDVTSVRINSFPFASSEVYYGDDLDLEGATLLVVNKKGESSVVDITSDMVSGYDKLAIGKQIVIVSYAGFDVKVEINVEALAVSRIDIATRPDEISVVQGGELNLAGVTLKVTYQNGRTVTVSQVTDVMVRGYSPDLAPGIHDIFIDYAGYSVALEIEVIAKTVISVKIVSEPSINSYFVKTADENEGALDATGLVIQRNFDNNTSDTLTYSADDEDFVFEYDFTRANAYSQVVMYYRDCYASFTVKVMEPVCSKVTITKQPVPVGVHLDPDHVSDLNSLIQGDRIDWASGTATVTYNDGTEIVGVSLADLAFSAFIDKFDSSGYIEDKENYVFNEVGTHIVYLRYGNNEFSSELYVTVVARQAYSMILADSRLPEGGTAEDGSVVLSGEFIDGSKFDTGYLRYNIVYDNNTYEYPVDDISSWASVNVGMLADDAGNTLTLSVANTDADGYQSVYFTVEGVKNCFRVKVVAKVATKLEITPPYKDYYAISSALDLTGSALYAEFNDKTVSRLSPIPEEYVALSVNGNETTSLNTTGTYTATVEYFGMSASFEFEVVRAEDAVTSVYFATLNADSIYYYDTYDSIFTSGIMLKVAKGDGSLSDLELTESLVVSSDPEATGYQEILFRYMGATFTLKVNVGGRYVTSIEVTRAPVKQVYVIGEDTALDISGLQITRLFNDNKYGQVENFGSAYWTFDGYDLTEEGTQTVNVTYNIDERTFRTSFDIIVTSSRIASITFAEDQKGMTRVEVSDGEFRNVLYVTYRGDLNTTYEYVSLVDGIEVREIDTLYITVNYVDGTAENIPLRAAYVSYDKNVIVDTSDDHYIQTAEIVFGGKTAYMDLYVVKRTLESINVYKMPDTLIYAEGQQLLTDGGYIQRVYSDGTTDVMPMTSGLISVSGYDPDPFANVQGATSKVQTITLTYSGKTAVYNITSYSKLETRPQCNKTVFSYGKTSDPIITFTMEIAGFTAPDTFVEYYVDRVWTSDTPKYPGSYPMRITVIENEYYKAKVWEGDDFTYTVNVATIVITVPGLTKEYGDADPELVYTIEEGELVPGDEIEVVLSRVPGEDVGTYAITAALTDSGFNQNALYKLTYDAASLIITPKQVGVSQSGKPINVTFGMPDNYHDGVIQYTGSEIRAISAQYNDGIGNVIIDARDIEYYVYANGEYVLMTELPKEKGTYKVRISSNYAFAEGAVYEIAFEIR